MMTANNFDNLVFTYWLALELEERSILQVIYPVLIGDLDFRYELFLEVICFVSSAC
jgi:hypothetical protein